MIPQTRSGFGEPSGDPGRDVTQCRQYDEGVIGTRVHLAFDGGAERFELRCENFRRRNGNEIVGVAVEDQHRRNDLCGTRLVGVQRRLPVGREGGALEHRRCCVVDDVRALGLQTFGECEAVRGQDVAELQRGVQCLQSGGDKGHVSTTGRRCERTDEGREL